VAQSCGEARCGRARWRKVSCVAGLRHGRAYGHEVAVLDCYNGKGYVGRWHGRATMAWDDHAASLICHG